MRQIIKIKTLFFLFLSFFFSVEAFSQAPAMDIDDKILVRILSVSETGRTILINRGEEHGVRTGQHARLSTPQEGYFARAVSIRVSPSRSVWSIYRIPISGVLRENLVATLKIATPVEVTDDETRSLGLLSSTYDRRVNEEIPEEQEERVRGTAPDSRLKDHFIVTEEERTRRIHQGRDFSNLHSSRQFERNPNINWENIDETNKIKRDRGQRDNIDYSALESRR